MDKKSERIYGEVVGKKQTLEKLLSKDVKKNGKHRNRITQQR
jgi:hypothetical protein